MNLSEIELSKVNERVLLANHGNDDLTMIKHYLVLFGLEADEATDVNDTQKMIREKEYGLVITDIGMSEIASIRTTSSLKKNRPYPDILIATNNPGLYDFKNSGNDIHIHFIEIPFSRDYLKNKLKDIFRQRSIVSIIINKKKDENKLLYSIIESLEIALNEKHKFTYGHSRRVANLSVQLANYVNMLLQPAEQIKKELINIKWLRLSCILHDVGKLVVPDYIINKKGELSVEEFEIMKSHPEKGVQILQPIESNSNFTSIIHGIKHHHERFDGTGYPSGLKGAKIPIFSRIIAITDTFDALTSDRPYRNGLQMDHVIEEIRNNSGSQFDPFLVDKFICMIEDSCGQGSCPNLDACIIFGRIEKDEISKAYKVQYCHFNYKACARLKEQERSRAYSDDLLPDGSFITTYMTTTSDKD